LRSAAILLTPFNGSAILEQMRSEVLEFFEENKGRILSVKEVSKEVDDARYQKDRTWAARELKQLWSKGYIEAINGCYWIPIKEDKESGR
jgi:hypothetical protein